MTTPINFIAEPITVTTTQAASGIRPGMNPNIFTPGGKLSAPVRPPAYTPGPQVQVVNSVPSGLKSAAVASPKTAFGFASRALGVGLGVVSAIAQDLIFPEPAGFGSDMVGGKPIQQTRPEPQKNGATKPATSTRTRTNAEPKPQRQTDSPVGRPDPFAPIAPQLESPIPSPAAQPEKTPAPRPFKPVDDAPRPGLDIDLSPGTGTITLAPINSKGKDLKTPSLLDQVTEG